MAVLAVAQRAVVREDPATASVLAQGGFAEEWGSCEDIWITVGAHQEIRLKLQAAVRVPIQAKLSH